MTRQNGQTESGQESRSTQIVLALIAAASAILVGYWQFVLPKKTHDEANGERPFIGRVIDATDGRRLQGAKVSLEAEGVPPVLYTDSEGIFSFNLASGARYVRLVIDARGYKLYDRRVGAGSISGIQDIRLAPILESGQTPNDVSTSTPTATSQQGTQLTEPAREALPPQQTTTAENQTGAGVELGSEITSPVLISRLDPHYPVVAQRLRKKATVDIKVFVGETGRVLDVQREGQEAGFGFDEAAIDAARRALFEPGMKDGKRVAMWHTLRINFR